MVISYRSISMFLSLSVNLVNQNTRLSWLVVSENWKSNSLWKTFGLIKYSNTQETQWLKVENNRCEEEQETLDT